MKRTHHQVLITLVLTISIALFATGCAKKTRVAKPPKIGSIETGIASWYGHPYHGRRAANGEVYDMEKLTAAHRTYPFETWVRVKNLSNDREVDVRIQDRGPFVRGRIIDLSRAAARDIELLGPGITKVRLTVIPPPRNAAQKAAPPPVSSEAPRPERVEPKRTERQVELFAVQVGAFRDQARALVLRKEMQQRFGAARIVERGGRPVMYRVLAGEFATIEEAEAAAQQSRQTGNGAMVVRLDEPPL